MSVTQNVNKDENIYTPDRKFNVSPGKTSLEIDNKAIGPNYYAFGVQSLMSNGESAPYESAISMSRIIDFSKVGLNETIYNSISIGKSGNQIWIELPQEAEISIYSVSGVKVFGMNGAVGHNVTEDLPTGIYIAKCMGKTYKVIL